MNLKKISLFSFLLLLALILIIFFVYKNVKYGPDEQANMSECNALYTKKGSVVNIVIFADREIAKKYADSLIEISPFAENKDKFSFYFINDYVPECELYKGVALFCYNKDLVKKATACPNDYIVVIDKSGTSIRSSSYSNVMSINEDNPIRVFAHEFGHSFSSLDEEYTPAKISYMSLNCKDDCSQFSGSCFSGCSESNHFRSVDKGIMRTLFSNTYGEFDKDLILKDINNVVSNYGFISGNVIGEENNCNNESYILINIEINDKDIKIINESLEIGCYGGNGNGDYYYYSLDKQGNILSGSKFSPKKIYTDIQNDESEIISGEIYEDYNRFFLKIPNDEKIAKIKVDDEFGNDLGFIELHTNSGINPINLPDVSLIQ
jgi:hypothetical protein